MIKNHKKHQIDNFKHGTENITDAGHTDIKMGKFDNSNDKSL